MNDNEKIKKDKQVVTTQESQSLAEEKCACKAEDCGKLGVKAVKGTASSSDDQIKELQEQLDSCQVARQEWKDKYVRILAEFDNFKKRMAKEQRVWADAAQANVLRELLAIIDDFDRAMQEQEKKEVTPEMQAWLDGFAMIHKAFHTFVKNQGIQEIPTDKAFDPNFHEAMMQVDSDEHESGQIVSVMQKGYLFKGNVLRPAKVSVAK